MTDRAPRPRRSSTLGRLERHTLLLGTIVLAAAALMTYVSIIAINGIPFSNPFRLRAIVPASAPVVRRGDEVIVAGQRVGEVRAVKVAAGGRLLEMNLDRGTVGRDASATVRLRGLAGATYVDLRRGDTAHAAPEGWTIPLARTRTNTPLTAVIADFDTQARTWLGRTLRAYGSGLTGRGQDLNATLADLPALVEDGRPLLQSFTPRPWALASFVHELHRTVRGFGGERSGDLGGLITAGRGTFVALASERDALGTTLEELRPFSNAVRADLPLADPVLGDAARAARALTPGVEALAAALPSLNSLLSRRAALHELSRLSHAADPVLGIAGPVLTTLYPGAASLQPLADAAEPFAAYVGRYASDVLAGPHGFTTWGGFHYDEAQAQGARAVRFAPVFTCARERDPYPAPGQASKDRAACR